MKTLFALCLVSSVAVAEPCFSPGPCEPIEPVWTTELCLPGGCTPVVYTRMNEFAIASTKLPNGYPMIGWAGPCFGECPDLFNQAWADLRMNALRTMRAQRYE